MKKAHATLEGLVEAAQKSEKGWATIQMSTGTIICNLETARSSKMNGGEWGRTCFYILRPDAEYRSRFSKAKAAILLSREIKAANYKTFETREAGKVAKVTPAVSANPAPKIITSTDWATTDAVHEVITAFPEGIALGGIRTLLDGKDALNALIVLGSQLLRSKNDALDILYYTPADIMPGVYAIEYIADDDYRIVRKNHQNEMEIIGFYRNTVDANNFTYVYNTGKPIVVDFGSGDVELQIPAPLFYK